MRMGKVWAPGGLAAGLVGFTMAEETKDKPKTIKQIMKTASSAQGRGSALQEIWGR